MSKIWSILSFLVGFAFVATTFADGAGAMLVVAIFSAITIIFIRQKTNDSDFLINIFLIALSLRLSFGLFIHLFDYRGYFGGDALTYHSLGKQIVDVWWGVASPDMAWSQRAMSTSGPGWGINYLTAFIYVFLGPNILAAQSFCAVIGAATAPMVYGCANKIFNNRRVSKIAALMVAVFPAFIIWSGQLLKDGLIIFLLVLAMTMVLQLQTRFNFLAVAILIFSLFGILSLRFYIFYMVAISVAGSFIIGQSGSVKSIARGMIVLIVLGLALTYLGVLRNASEDFDKYASLERIQTSRSDLVRSADSGFGGDVDVSTSEGAITAIPLGLTYLMLAPFPWEMANFRQVITLPEILIWWASIPLLFSGLWYTMKNRLRNAIPILIFTLMLTIAYSIFQGNVGTAYRQRTQIQVFLFIFIAVGWTLIQEKRENKKLQRLEKQRQTEKYLKEMRNANSINTPEK